MSEINNKLPVVMEFSIASITTGIEFWLNKVVLQESLVVDKIIWDSRDNKFIVTIDRGIQVGQKL